MRVWLFFTIFKGYISKNESTQLDSNVKKLMSGEGARKKKFMQPGLILAKVVEGEG